MYHEKQAAIAQQTYVTGNAQRDRGQMEVAMDSVGNSLDEAYMALNRLYERLDSVLQPEMPQPAPAPSTAGGTLAEPPHSVAINRLHGLRAQVESLTFRINALNMRLET